MKPVSPRHRIYLEILTRLTAGGAVDGLISAFIFEKEGPLQSLIHQLKYSGMTLLGEEFGKRIGTRIERDDNPGAFAGLIPVPLHRAKLRERGYNQSEHICRGVSTITGIPALPSVLRRRKYTESQTTLRKEERTRNVADAFMLDDRSRGEVEGKDFLVVDDVITTGSTVSACARVLIANGAKRVVACSIALAE